VRKVMIDPLKVQIGVMNATASAVKQNIVYVGKEDAKLMTLRQSIKEGFEPPMLIFVQSKTRAKELYHELIFDGVNVNVIHGDKKKHERDAIITQFRMGEIWVLICTDLMARGIDFKTVNSVINFDFPTSLVSYIHRVGRTGRAGREGTATTYFTDEDVPYVKNIANLMLKSGHDVPEWMLKLKSAHNKEWKKIELKPLRRQTISTRIKDNIDYKFMK
jgi:ATP-dependent RNA helicase DDX52/ROK1